MAIYNWKDYEPQIGEGVFIAKRKLGFRYSKKLAKGLDGHPQNEPG